MAQAYKCDICGEFFEVWEDFRGITSENDDGDILYCNVTVIPPKGKQYCKGCIRKILARLAETW